MRHLGLLGDDELRARGLAFNLLGTAGHHGFQQGQLQPLTAVDSAVMVLDADPKGGGGIEEQTRKLFKVCTGWAMKELGWGWRAVLLVKRPAGTLGRGGYT